jgi:hypothetical protein
MLCFSADSTLSQIFAVLPFPAWGFTITVVFTFLLKTIFDKKLATPFRFSYIACSKIL